MATLPVDLINNYATTVVFFLFCLKAKCAKLCAKWYKFTFK